MILFVVAQYYFECSQQLFGEFHQVNLVFRGSNRLNHLKVKADQPLPIGCFWVCRIYPPLDALFVGG